MTQELPLWQPLVPNQMILASAGSGKTYRLTNRFIYLMAKDQEPEEIVALTFTRKAAGEFFDAILNKLADACTDPEKLASLQSDLDLDDSELGPNKVARMLEKLLKRMHLLTLGTLDSFFISILQSYPFEFGLGSGFELLETHAHKARQALVLHEIFRSLAPSGRGQAGKKKTGGGGTPASDDRSFLDAFRLATFGSEEKSLGTLLEEFIANYHRKYLRGPFAERWGNAAAIWPERVPAWTENVGDQEIRDAGQRLSDILENTEKTTNPKAITHLRELFDAASELDAGGRLEKKFDTVIKNLFGELDAIREGAAEFNACGCKVRADSEACRCLLTAIHRILLVEFNTALNRTRGIYQVLDRYETEYNQRVRRLGQLTFEDVQLLLSGVLSPGGSSGSGSGSSSSHHRRFLSLDSQDISHLKIDDRLGARYNHWLLDEFQDTSHLQWRALENLIDEAIQDDSGERSFFYVGDEKQAIYGWRGGDSRLFQEIFRHYNRGAEPAIESVGMHQSYRSGPDIIDPVNAIFHPTPSLTSMLPAATVSRWTGIWADHATAFPDRSGYTECIRVERAKGNKGLPPEVLFQGTLDILERVRPHERGISCAVIVRKNKFARGIAEYIRAHSGIPVEVDAEFFVAADNPFSSAIVSLLKLVAHPGDSYARQHVLMTPLASSLARPDRGLEKSERDEGGDKLGADFLQASLATIHDSGFESLLETWLARHEAAEGALDPFTSRRAVELRMAARLFDETGDRSIDAFLDYLETFSINDPSVGGVVQVMTIHKAKGLGFDMVVLPEIGFNQNSVSELQKVNLVTKENEDRELEWALDLPNKQTTNADPVLAEFRSGLEADAAFANLCDLYVGLTRAKRSNHILVVDPGKKENNAAVVLNGLTLAEEPTQCEILEHKAELVFEQGDRDWFLSEGDSGSSQEEGASEQVRQMESRASSIAGLRRRFPRRQRRLPSSLVLHDRATAPDGGGEAETIKVTAPDRTALDHGTVVHLMFEQIEWLDPADTDFSALKSRLQAVPLSPRLEPLRANALFQILTILTASEDCRTLFTMENQEAKIARLQLWREKPFELILDGKWVSGIFDRVHLHASPDASGSITSATIIDFKTDPVPSDELLREAKIRYKPQMDLYRTALARLLGLASDSITIQILFTNPPELESL